MEKMIINLMEIVSYMQKGEIYDELELTKSENYQMRYLIREILQNELNKREGLRHISLESAKEYYEKKQAAFK